MTDHAAYFAAHGHAPESADTICIDFDGTLYPRVGLFTDADPLSGAVEGVARLRAAGKRIVIFTSRLAPEWLAAAKQDESEMRDYIETKLTRDGIGFDQLTGHKVPASAYVDDLAIRFRDGEWEAITDWLLFASDAS